MKQIFQLLLRSQYSCRSSGNSIRIAIPLRQTVMRCTKFCVQALVTISLWAFGGCATAPYLSFEPSSPTIPSSAAQTIVNQLNAGTMSLHDIRLVGARCEVAVDYGHSAVGTVRGNGALGARGFNVVLSSSPFNPRVPCSPLRGAQSPTGILIASARNIVLHQKMRSGDASLFFGDETFSSRNGFIEFKLDSFNTSTHFATGTFEFFAKNRDNPSDPRVLVVVNGQFGLRIQ
jgi:hypothetical protein